MEVLGECNKKPIKGTLAESTLSRKERQKKKSPEEVTCNELFYFMKFFGALKLLNIVLLHMYG